METTTQTTYTVTVHGFVFDGVLQERVLVMLDKARARWAAVQNVTFTVDSRLEAVTFSGTRGALLGVLLQYTEDDLGYTAHMYDTIS